MDILGKINEYGLNENLVAYSVGDKTLTYKELNEASDILAAFIEKNSDNKSPIAVYGHKSPKMLIAMLACVKSGRGYCPIDVNVPESRVEMIIEQLDSRIVLTTEAVGFSVGEKTVIDENAIEEIVAKAESRIERSQWVKAEDIFYIIFTSGSTGVPKGVTISTQCLNNFLDWSVELSKASEGTVFINQAPFSFDLSVMDLYTSLAVGGKLWVLEKEVQNDYEKLMNSLGESCANVWVSTPSFADMCLSEKRFDKTLMPNMNTFMFCGETLTCATASKLKERFPGARVINTYGPTESTVAITDVTVDEAALATYSVLPVGRAKPGTSLEIWDENGNVVSGDERGEIIILGNTVSPGYYKREDVTKKAFFTCVRDGKEIRGYHTGDKGYLVDGMLFYCGRIDLQIKLHGYRIEIEDIESNIMKLSCIDGVVVLPNMQDGKVKSITAYVKYNGEIDSKLKVSKAIKDELKEFLPQYMIPKTFKFVDRIPMTNNGKADRKALQKEVEDELL